MMEELRLSVGSVSIAPQTSKANDGEAGQGLQAYSIHHISCNRNLPLAHLEAMRYDTYRSVATAPGHDGRRTELLVFCGIVRDSQNRVEVARPNNDQSVNHFVMQLPSTCDSMKLCAAHSELYAGDVADRAVLF